MLARLRARLPSNAALAGFAFGAVLQLVAVGLVSAALSGGMSDGNAAPRVIYPVE